MFSRKLFGDVHRMLNALKSQGFRVTVQVSPFAAIESSVFKNGSKYLVNFGRKELPSDVKY